MACGMYEEFSNGLKMSLVGLALGALVFFIAGPKTRDRPAKKAHYAGTAEREQSGRRIAASMFKGWR